MKNKITLLLIFIPCFLFGAKPFNEWGERFFSRADKELIIVEHKDSEIEGYTTYSIYFPSTLHKKVLDDLMLNSNILYLDYSYFKLTVVLNETKNIKKELKSIANNVWKQMDKYKNQELSRKLMIKSWRNKQ